MWGEEEARVESKLKLMVAVSFDHHQFRDVINLIFHKKLSTEVGEPLSYRPN